MLWHGALNISVKQMKDVESRK